MSSVSQKGVGGFVDYWDLEKTGLSRIFWNDFGDCLGPGRTGPSPNHPSRFG